MSSISYLIYVVDKTLLLCYFSSVQRCFWVIHK